MGEGRPQHATRTYFSRTARDERWWSAYLGGSVPSASLSGSVPVSASVPASEPGRTEAYEALAALGLRDPRLVLSASECAELEGRAGEWLARDVNAERFAYAMASGLSPLPAVPAVPQGPVPPVWLRPECIDCGRPVRRSPCLVDTVADAATNPPHRHARACPAPRCTAGRRAYGTAWLAAVRQYRRVLASRDHACGRRPARPPAHRPTPT